jgi:cytoskeletal protein CcmA (bactofilin family)
MARKSHEDALGVAGAETVIGTGVTVVGNLASDSDIAIDGNLDGNITAGGNVTVGINANVKGDIEGTNITVAGNLTGNVKATGEASILETGHVKGNIRANSLAINSGGIFNGRSLMEVSSPLSPDDESESIRDVRGS